MFKVNDSTLDSTFDLNKQIHFLVLLSSLPLPIPLSLFPFRPLLATLTSTSPSCVCLCVSVSGSPLCCAVWCALCVVRCCGVISSGVFVCVLFQMFRPAQSLLRPLQRSTTVLPAATFPTFSQHRNIATKHHLSTKDGLRMSGRMLQKMSRNLLADMDMLVCDMAGTTIDEGGVVYTVLRQSMVKHGMDVTEADMHPWHGAKKEAVIEHFLQEKRLKDSFAKLKLDSPLDPETARLVWNKYDSDKNGLLDVEESKKFVKQLCKSKGWTNNDEVLQQFIDSYDQDKDGFISWSEILGKPSKEETNAIVERVADEFLKSIDQAYFDEASPVEHIDLTLVSYFRQLQSAGIKVALDTGYPPEIQMGLMKKMKFDKVVDGKVSAYEVKQGRPYPYMIFKLMEDLNIMSVKRVAKAGDSARDMEEGRNAGCGLVIGVLSGADDEATLIAAGADVVVRRITDIPVPHKTPNQSISAMMPDLLS